MLKKDKIRMTSQCKYPTLNDPPGAYLKLINKIVSLDKILIVCFNFPSQVNCFIKKKKKT